MSKTQIRNAATIIMLRDRHGTPSVLMGQRGAGAAFMPSKFVFPGGAVDDVDHTIPMGAAIGSTCRDRLAEDSALPADALAAAAIRELWEETGQVLGAPGKWPDAPQGWRGFAATGHQPNGAALTYIFRAITPPGLPRRFDARFFLADADALISDPDDFSQAEDELSHLHWAPLAEVRALDLPFITEVVLAEVSALVGQDGPPASVPYFKNEDERFLVERLKGRSPLDAALSQQDQDQD